MAAEWKNIMLYDSQIVTMTAKSALIRTPRGWKFWHPAKCMHAQRGGMIEMSYTDDFKFHLFKDAKTRTGWHKTAEREVGAEEIEEEFARQAPVRDERFIVEEPDYLLPEKCEVSDDLRV